MSIEDEEIHIKPFILLEDINIETIKEDVNNTNKEFERIYMGKFIIDKNKKYTRIEKALKVLGPKYSKSTIQSMFCPHDIIDNTLEELDINTYVFDDPNSRYGTGCRGITCEECWDKEL